MDSLGTYATQAVELVLILASVYYALRKGNSGQAEHISETISKKLVGKGDPTPKHVEDRDTGLFALVVRSELEPIRAEQRRQGRKIDQVDKKVELLTSGLESVKERQAEMSAEIAQDKSRADVEAMAERLDLPLDPPPAGVETGQS